MLTALLYALTPAAPWVVEADLRGSGWVQRVVLDPSRDPSLSIWQGQRKLWEDVRRKWNPWRLDIADVDSDGILDIVVALDKSTKFLPDPHHTFFIYGFDGTRGRKKWLGSTLGRPFTDFRFAAVRGKTILLTVDSLPDGTVTLASRTWNGFGFRHLGDHGTWNDLRIVGLDAASLTVVADGKRAVFALHDLASRSLPLPASSLSGIRK